MVQRANYANIRAALPLINRYVLLPGQVAVYGCTYQYKTLFAFRIDGIVDTNASGSILLG